MSDSLNKNLELVTVLDARLSAPLHKEYALLQGSPNIREVFLNYSSKSDQQISFNNVDPPGNGNVFINRVIPLSVSYDITINGSVTAPTTSLLAGWGQGMAPRSNFVQKSINSSQMVINNCAIPDNTNQNMQAYERINFKNFRKYQTGTCVCLDNSQQYSEMKGSVRNPLASYKDGVFDDCENRGGFASVQVLSDTPTQAVIRITGYENLVMSPLCVHDSYQQGFIGVNTLNFNFVLMQPMAPHILSISNTYAADFGVNISNISVSPSAATMSFVYYDPPIDRPIPEYNSYEYNNVNNNIKDITTTLASGASLAVTGDALQLDYLPRKIICYVSEKIGDRTTSSTDTFCRINSATVQMGNNQTYLTEANPYQLWQISKNNQLDMDFSEWYGKTPAEIAAFPGANHCDQVSMTGGILVFSPVYDLGIKNMIPSGANEKLTLKVTLNVTNLSGRSMNVSMNVITVSSGMLTLGNGSGYRQDSVVDVRDLLKNNENMKTYLTSDAQFRAEFGSGGAFLPAIAAFVKNAIPYVVQALPHIKNAIHFAKTVGAQKGPLLDRLLNKDNLSLIGLGGCGCMGGKHDEYKSTCPACKAYKKHLKGRGLVGGEMMGGRALSRATLKNLLD